MVALVTLIFLYKSFPVLKSKFEIFHALSLTLTVILFVMATKMGAAANAIFLQSTAPLYVAIFGALILKEKLRAHDFVILGIVGVGMLLFFADDMSATSLQANILGLSSGLTFAVYILMSRKAPTEGSFRAIIWGNFFTVLICAPALLKAVPTQNDILGLLFLGVFQLALSYYIYCKAAPYVSALKASLIFLLEPLLNPIWVFLVVGERPSPKALVGGLLVIGALAIKQIWDARNPAPT